ncbi:succinic semialdehyde dehydrogenase [Mycolicibacterium brisbanense]|uniref:Aldehyde dehydrogenase n=1 Tax=Mycolicibacterium brisbanense TaxID=146020 RepID=A0A100VXV1_9MYCO|nr:succinic semialdehyde dehydrogenase [Mycolicibacterium brisbanense]MCV7157769.1 aldehyde dehydrogenase family protein [Mycolicibacterium brisbanense]GAS87997.1 aldehyde dehydrogenase [Mycolicibacterium brisbanense]
MSVVEELAVNAPTALGDTRELTAPFTGLSLAIIPQHTVADVESALARARSAQKQWACRPLSERQDLIERLLGRLRRDRAALFDILQLEGGKARIDACSDYGEAILSGSRYTRHAERLLRPDRHSGAIPGLTTTTEVRHPVGVVVVIAPWNAPIGVGGGDSIPALLAGNAVILKPDNQTALSTVFLRNAALSAGIPGDVFQVVLGDPAEIGDALIDGADYVAFTGSTATGRKIAVRAGERLIGCSLELGGKNPMIVLPDADLARAASAVPRASFANAGQVCLTTERLYVHASIFDEFIDLACARTLAMRLGAAIDFSCDMGSLTTVSGFRRLAEYVEQARATGALVRTGGRCRPDLGPLFYEPTILSGVTPTADLHTAEVFGPVVAVEAFETEDAVVEAANDTAYGLSASVWTRDTKQGARLAARIETGAVNINDAYAAAFASHGAPSGGRKASGRGRRHGVEGMLRYTESQVVAVQRLASPDSRLGLPRETHGRLMGAALGAMTHLPR